MSETQTQPAAERHQFGAEVGRLLDLVVHSLYSEREIFLRELVANAADATDRRRFETLTDAALAAPEGAAVRIVPDKAARTLTISDDGIGMSRDELVANLGTIARSGTRAFGEALSSGALADAKPDERPNLIGQFGVGFYAAFMVAERVEVVSRRAGTDQAWLWASEGRGDYTLAQATRETAGTTITLHIKPDADEFLEPYRLETIVRKWADHIALPILLTRDGKEVAANEGTALWRKPKSTLDDEAYKGFYKHLGNYFDEPWATLHWRAEGNIEFAALLFVPGAKPFDPMDGELLPPFLRFVQGVVDTEDLPLNVSREMLQATPVLARIRKAVTNRVLSELKTRAGDEAGYAGFWDNFGAVVKEGAYDAGASGVDVAKDLTPLLRFRSSSEPELTSLAAYVGRMKPGQQAIYYLLGDSHESLAASPQLEGFRARGLEVLLLSDPVDAFWPDRLDSFEDKPLRSVTQGAADLSAFKQEGEHDADAPDTARLIEALKATLGEDVADIRATDRLTDSAVVLAAAEQGPDLQMQRLLRRSGRAAPPAAPVLEINPRHALIRSLAERAEARADIADGARTLLDLARVQDGEPPRDPAAFARRVAAALQAALGHSADDAPAA